MRFFEDLEIGQRRELGSFTFTAELIRKFATQFDPQRFHLDEEAGRNSLFGGLAASGWHVGSVCMKLLVADGQRSPHAKLIGDLGSGTDAIRIIDLFALQVLTRNSNRCNFRVLQQYRGGSGPNFAWALSWLLTQRVRLA